MDRSLYGWATLGSWIGYLRQCGRWWRAAAVIALVAVQVNIITAAPASAQDQCQQPGQAALPDQTPWHLVRMRPEAVWPLTRGAGVTVAVIDSGVSATHPMLADVVRPGRDFAAPDHAGRCDEDGHGTMIAGIIAGAALPGVTIYGMAPEATILPARVLLTQGQAPPGAELPDRLAAAITWAVEEGADVINLSVQARHSSDLEDAVAAATGAGVLLVAAAGNLSQDGRPGPAYPAAFPEVIAVAGVDAEGNQVESSQSGEYVDIAAPGRDILGPAPGDGFRYQEAGTSFAAGYVTGTAALVRAYYPELGPREVTERLVRTADRPPEGHTAQLGYGVVNPYQAVTMLLGSRSNPPAEPAAAPLLTTDPWAPIRRAAPWLLVSALGIVLIILSLPAAIRRGRRRGWRPERSSSLR